MMDKEEVKENFAYVRISEDIMNDVTDLASKERRSKTNMVSVLLSEAIAARKRKARK